MKKDKKVRASNFKAKKKKKILHYLKMISIFVVFASSFSFHF